MYVMYVGNVWLGWLGNLIHILTFIELQRILQKKVKILK